MNLKNDEVRGLLPGMASSGREIKIASIQRKAKGKTRCLREPAFRQAVTSRLQYLGDNDEAVSQ